MLKIRLCLVLAVAGFVLPDVSSAGPEKFQERGFVSNDAGAKCGYRQTVISGALHFHGDAIATTIGEIVFDDPQCMADSGQGLGANKSMINKLISTWYSHPDANFDTTNLRKTSLYQVVGECMQSRSYAAIGVAIEYIVENQSITKVVHGPTLEGCL
jgi:hypothetical protein